MESKMVDETEDTIVYRDVYTGIRLVAYGNQSYVYIELQPKVYLGCLSIDYERKKHLHPRRLVTEQGVINWTSLTPPSNKGTAWEAEVVMYTVLKITADITTHAKLEDFTEIYQMHLPENLMSVVDLIRFLLWARHESDGHARSGLTGQFTRVILPK